MKKFAAKTPIQAETQRWAESVRRLQKTRQETERLATELAAQASLVSFAEFEANLARVNQAVKSFGDFELVPKGWPYPSSPADWAILADWHDEYGDGDSARQCRAKARKHE